MKRFLTTSYNKNILDIWLLLLRFSIGVAMLTHGLPKLGMLFSGDEVMFIDPLGLGMTISLILVVFAEFFCSILLIVGFGTRLSSIVLIFTMFIAVFVFHAGDPFVKKELGLIYMLIYINILVLGAGKFSVDKLISKR
jgi:putative oxidoreductase